MNNVCTDKPHLILLFVLVLVYQIGYRKILSAQDKNFSYELYNLQNDSLEKNNLINIESGMARILKAELEAKISSQPVYNRKKSEFIPEIDSQGRENIQRTGYW